MPNWFWLSVGLAAVLASLVIILLRDGVKLKRKITAGFGRPPKQLRGLENAERYYADLAKKHPDENAVDNLTWNDLDMDAIFARLNACQSAAGDVRLYSVLRRPVVARAEAEVTLAERAALMALFEAQPALRLKAQYRLARLGRADGSGLSMAAFFPEALVLGHRWLFVLLGLLPLLLVPVLFFSLPLGAIAIAAAVVANIVISSVIKGKNEGRFRAVRFLAGCLTCARQLAALLQTAHPATAQKLRAALAGFRSSALPILIMNFNELTEAAIGFDFTHFFQLPLLAYGSVAALLTGSGPQTLALFNALGEVDLAAALLSYRASLPLHCAPAFTGAPTLCCTGLYHPLLSDPVPNSATFSQNTLFTGSNASGKSTFIKAVALNCLFAQTIGICTASAFALKCGAVATSMAVEDSVVDGDSYFVAEIKSMRRLMRRAGGGQFCWIFIDEILKGTNTVERVAASAAVLCQLAGQSCLVFAATHDMELTAILNELYANRHFRETVAASLPAGKGAPTAENAGGTVYFDYKLHDGPATTRNAILLLERMDFPPAVTTGARALVARFEQAGEWGELPAEQG